MILLIDNYDSFTYNLYQYIGEMYTDIEVYRNDAISIDEIKEKNPAGIILSPGPGRPESAGICLDVINEFKGKTPILGVCLGYQSIVQALGGTIVHAKTLVHGKADDIKLDNKSALFLSMPDKIKGARYHSLAAGEVRNLKVTAKSGDGEIMAVEGDKLYGVQFHPESILTEYGRHILKNFLNIAGLEIAEDIEEKYSPKQKSDGLKPYLQRVIDSKDLTQEQAREAMNHIMSGNATNAQIGSFMTAMRMKGETIDEITGFARTLRDKAAYMEKQEGTLDIVGTGGDLAKTFNISTASAIVAAASGVKVSKHGNRSVSSLSGSADVLEALGVKIDITSQQALKCLRRTDLCFMFAPVFHKSMKFAASPRKEIGVRSVFNILGPLSNPAKADYMLLGVYDRSLIETVALVLRNLGVQKALVVYGSDGLDEVTLTGETEVCEIDGNKLLKYNISPEDYGLNLCSPNNLTGGLAEENAEILLNILKGEKGAKRDIVVLNSACAIYCAGKAAGIEEGVRIAQEALDSGKALSKLEELIKVSNEL